MDPRADRRRQRGPGARLVPVALTVLLAAGCTTSVDGSGRLAPGAVAAGSSAATSGGSTDSTSGPAGSASASPSASGTTAADGVEDTADLVDVLMDVPSGAQGDASSWGANRTPTLAEFGARVYRGGGIDPTDYLSESGVTAITHRGWIAADGNAADVALLLFADDVQPATWVSRDADGLRQAGAPRVVLDDIPAALGYTFTQKSETGSTVTRFLLSRGKVGVMIDYFYTGTFDAAQAAEWVGAQDDLLR